MICLCKMQVAALGAKLATIDTHFNLNLLSLLDLPKLSLMLGAMESAQLAASLNLSLLPPALAGFNVSASLGLNMAGAMDLLSLGMSIQGLKLALGLDLTAKNAAAQLAPLAQSAAAAWPSLSALLTAELAKLLDLLPLASLVLKAKALGVNLLQADASAQLAAALSLSARLSIPLPSMSAHLALMLQVAALVAQIKIAFGIDLGMPGGMAQLQSMLSLMANIHLPQIRLNLPSLAKLLGLISAYQTIKLAFGIDLGTPGAGLQLSMMLKLMLSLKLPQLNLTLPALNLPALKLALSLNLKGLDLPKLALMLGNVPHLGLGSLSSLLSLTAAIKLAFAINLAPTITLGCGPICPLAIL